MLLKCLMLLFKNATVKMCHGLRFPSAVMDFLLLSKHFASFPNTKKKDFFVVSFSYC